MTQHEAIVQWVKEHGSITSYEAYRRLGITQLAARIKELENRGTFFTREWVEDTNRYGCKVRYVKYSLNKDVGTEWIKN